MHQRLEKLLALRGTPGAWSTPLVQRSVLYRVRAQLLFPLAVGAARDV